MSDANAAVPQEGSAFNSSTSTSEQARALDATGRGLFGKYLLVLGVMAVFLTVLFVVVDDAPGASQAIQDPRVLIQPVVALAGLTGVVWLLMVLYRNLAFIRGRVSERYFQTYTVDAPAEWVERPTRAYMNLLELPVLFYVVCLLMMTTQKFDGIQVSLAWLFVCTRIVHAFIYIALNYIPLRFVSYLTGVITLGVMWARFAEQSL